MNPPFTTPGVYINELQAFPNSVVPAKTAVPAFVGYTAGASFQGKDLRGVPTQISSWAEFEACFGASAEPTDASSLPGTARAVESAPVYHLVPAGKEPGDLTISGTSYHLLPDPGTLYSLDLSLRLFFANGGGPCYVVSAGLRKPGTGTPLSPGQPWVNPNLLYSELKAALDALESVPDITLIVLPEATLLPFADYGTLLRDLLNQCGTLGDRMGILDVYGAQHAAPASDLHDLIEPFRAAVGQQHLKYGAAYFPFLKTTVVAESEVTLDRLGGGASVLTQVLPGAAQEPVKSILASLQQPIIPVPMTRAQLESALVASSPTYAHLLQRLAERLNTLPPSGAIAGVYARVDEQRGVWEAPANVSLTHVVGTTLAITDDMQAGLNVDPVTGKSVNALRTFPAHGVLVWGARTLDGNSSDWRYIPVVRTVVMIEQSVKTAVQAYVFEPNDERTWAAVRATLTSFLTQLWQQGALAGATANAAFSVAVGLGSTMTAQDILDGVMNISLSVALTHPAEFIVITFSQQMQAS